MNEEKSRWVENSIMRLTLACAESVLGAASLNAVLRVSGLEHYLDAPPRNDNQLVIPGDEYAALFKGIVQMYGEQVARGILRRWGTEFGERGAAARPAAKLLRPMLSLLPLQRRTLTLLDALVHEADHARGEPLHALRVTDDAYHIIFADCLYCRALRTTEPACTAVVGTIEAVLAWGTGRNFAVTETTCQARGDAACTFVIDKQPLHV